MNAAHLHLALNHVPVLGTALVVPLSLVLTRGSLWTLVGLACASTLVYLTGEPAEEIVSGLQGVTKALIERHEEAAEVATLLTVGMGAIAAGALIVLRRRGSVVQRRLSLVILVLSLVPASAMAYAAYLGGQIQHPELRPEPAASALLSATDYAIVQGRGSRRP